MALAFLPNPENKLQVNHIDWNKLNNNLENLEWCTVSENALHAYKMWLSWKNNPFNIRNPSKWKFWKNSIISKVLYQYSLDWKLLNKWHWIREASRNLWIKPQSISNNCNGRAKTTGWFIFKF